MSSGFQLALSASVEGKAVASRVIKPTRHSSCDSAGMPSRVSLRKKRCNLFSPPSPLPASTLRAPSAPGLDGVPAQRPRDLPAPVGQAPLKRWLIGAVDEPHARAHMVLSVLREDQPEGVHLRDLLVQAHALEQVAHTGLDGLRRVLVGGW